MFEHIFVDSIPQQTSFHFDSSKAAELLPQWVTANSPKLRVM